MNVFRLLLIFCAGLVAGVAHAQPQWRFHLAFEDATGARDTIWYIWDETAHEGFPVDIELGEGRVEMDLNAFNVWVHSQAGDSTKTHAIPYLNWFPLFPGAEIRAFNYEYPITIRWDRSLFHAPYLPDPDAINTAWMTGMYFYGFSNLPFGQVFSMLHDDSVVVNELTMSPLFPFSVYIDHLNTIGIEDLARNGWSVYEADGLVHVRIGEGRLREVWVLDASGRVVAHSGPMNGSFNMPFHDAPPGLYIVHALTFNNTYHHGKFIKMAR